MNAIEAEKEFIYITSFFNPNPMYGNPIEIKRIDRKEVEEEDGDGSITITMTNGVEIVITPHVHCHGKESAFFKCGYTTVVPGGRYEEDDYEYVEEMRTASVWNAVEYVYLFRHRNALQNVFDHIQHIKDTKKEEA